IVAGNSVDAGAVVGTAGGQDARVGIDLVAPGKGRAPTVVVEGAGEVVHVGGTIAFRPIVGVVEVQLVFVAPKAAALGAVDRQVVIDAGDDRLAVAPLNQGRRHGPRRRVEVGMAPGIGPGGVWCEERRATIAYTEEVLPWRRLRQREDIADLGEELVPTLMRKDLAGRASRHRAAPGNGIGEVGRAGAVGRGREIGMVGEPTGIGFTAIGAAEYGVDFGAALEGRDGDWGLQVEAMHG